MSEKDEIIQQVGSLIISDERAQRTEWAELSMVIRLGNGEKAANGYRYVGADFFGGFTADSSFDVIDLMIKLRDVMVEDGDKPWHQALIHIVREGLKFNIQFEYDDPHRWSLTAKSLDMSDYANSLRPPADM